MKHKTPDQLQLVRDLEALIEKYSFGQMTPWEFYGIVEFKMHSFVKQILEHPDQLGDD